MALSPIVINEGTGTPTQADAIAGVKYAIVKLAFGPEGTATLVSSSSPLPFTGNLSLVGNQHIGEVGGNCAIITPTITVSTAIYAAGDVVGGQLTLTNAMRIVDGSGVLQDVLVTTADGELFECKILIFDSDPTATIADQIPWAWSAGDHAKLLGVVEVITTDYDTFAGDGVAHVRNLGMVVKANGTAHLYAYVIATGTPTFAATTDLSIRLKFMRD